MCRYRGEEFESSVEGIGNDDKALGEVSEDDTALLSGISVRVEDDTASGKISEKFDEDSEKGTLRLDTDGDDNDTGEGLIEEAI
jgi:hypothetical protein